jgi:hypothetical protein
VLSFDRLLSRTQNGIASGNEPKMETILEAAALLGTIALGIWLALDMIY